MKQWSLIIIGFLTGLIARLAYDYAITGTVPMFEDPTIRGTVVVLFMAALAILAAILYHLGDKKEKREKQIEKQERKEEIEAIIRKVIREVNQGEHLTTEEIEASVVRISRGIYEDTKYTKDNRKKQNS
mgnify:CR=1 FL=1